MLRQFARQILRLVQVDRSEQVGRSVAFVLLLAGLCGGCESGYDVTARMSDGEVRLIGLPSRPVPDGPLTATVAVAGAKVLANRDGTADIVFADGRRQPLISLRTVAPFPAALRTRPTDDTVATQALSAQIFLWRLLQPLPDVLRTATEQGDPTLRPQAIAVARKLLSTDRIPISGRLGRWWQFAGYYRLTAAERERLAAAVGTAASGPAG